MSALQCSLSSFSCCRNTIPRGYIFSWHNISNWLSVQTSKGMLFMNLILSGICINITLHNFPTLLIFNPIGFSSIFCCAMGLVLMLFKAGLDNHGYVLHKQQSHLLKLDTWENRLGWNLTLFYIWYCCLRIMNTFFYCNYQRSGNLELSQTIKFQSEWQEEFCFRLAANVMLRCWAFPAWSIWTWSK